MEQTTQVGPAFVVWHRKERGPISPPFATRDEARRFLGEVYGGRPGLEVRRVAL